MNPALRIAAEHEAGHAVVAAHYGLTVTDIHVRADGSGVTHVILNDATPAQRAAVTAAGDLWQREFCTLPYRDGACSDLRRFEAEYGLDRLWAANRAARQILTIRRRAVLSLADRLVDERVIKFPGAAA